MSKAKRIGRAYGVVSGSSFTSMDDAIADLERQMTDIMNSDEFLDVVCVGGISVQMVPDTDGAMYYQATQAWTHDQEAYDLDHPPT